MSSTSNPPVGPPIECNRQFEMFALHAARKAADTEASSEAIVDLGSRIGTEIREIGIPPWPAILRRIEAGVHKDDADFDHLAGLIGLDVALGAALIKVAGSPPHGEPRSIGSVSEALMTLGTEATARAIAGLALQRVFPRLPKLEAFWRSSAHTALVAGWLAAHLGQRSPVDAGTAYTFGLLRDCAKPLLMIPFPEYESLLRDDGTAEEDELLTTNHAALGAALAEEWLLPHVVCGAIRHHHNLPVIDGELADRLPARARQLIAMGRLADHLVRSSGEPRQPGPAMNAGCLRVLGISEDERDHLGGICHQSGQAIVATL